MVSDQLCKVVFSGLYSRMHAAFVTCCGQEQGDADACADLVRKHNNTNACVPARSMAALQPGKTCWGVAGSVARVCRVLLRQIWWSQRLAMVLCVTNNLA